LSPAGPTIRPGSPRMSRTWMSNPGVDRGIRPRIGFDRRGACRGGAGGGRERGGAVRDPDSFKQAGRFSLPWLGPPTDARDYRLSMTPLCQPPRIEAHPPPRRRLKVSLSMTYSIGPIIKILSRVVASRLQTLPRGPSKGYFLPRRKPTPNPSIRPLAVFTPRCRPVALRPHPHGPPLRGPPGGVTDSPRGRMAWRESCGRQSPSDSLTRRQAT
jgi:hypothetical protein